jgi:hypothetical protein
MKKCPACQVIIEDGLAKFSVGKPNTLAQLKAKVCQFSKHPELCINRTTELVKSEGWGNGIDERIPMETALEWVKDLTID